jgi:hypothetical protein
MLYPAVALALCVGAWLIARQLWRGVRAADRWLAGAAVLAVLALLIGAALHRTKRTPVVPPVAVAAGVFLDRPLGLEPESGIDEKGFWNTEVSKNRGDTFRWTDGAARLTVPLGDRPPTAMHLHLGVTHARTVPLRIVVNGRALLDEHVPMRMDWTRIVELADVPLGKEAVIEVQSDTMDPAAKLGSTDVRLLGVCFRGLTLFSGTRSYVGVPLGVRLIPEVAESGFHGPETSGGKPCRWTDGAARLVVPLRDHRPTSLGVTLEIPDRPEHLVRIAVNGQTLFEEKKFADRDWSADLPLKDVVLGDKAVIELTGDVVVPAQRRPETRDDRKLGVRVKRLVLTDVTK